MRTIFALCAITTSLGLTIPLWSQAIVRENLETVTLYVDGSTGSDTNPGTQSMPYQSIGAAASKALLNKEASLGTQVIINPGTYRESISLLGTSKQSTLPITLQAAISGTVIVSGSVQYTGWSTYSGNNSIYTKAWPYRWGACPIDTGGPPLEQPIVLRSEMVFVNDTMITQVMSLSQMLFPGSFFVDENKGEIYLWPPTATDINSADVEVAVKSPVLFIDAPGKLAIDGIVVRGLTFEHARSCHTEGAVVVSGSASNILFDTDSFIWNNGSGSHFNGPSANVTVKNTIANHNGASGFNTYQLMNALWDHDTASYNNWRGAQGAFYEWGAAGAHLFSDHFETWDTFTSTFNETHSIHWDTDSQNIIVSSLFSAQNMFGALFEKNLGPLTFSNSYLCSTQAPTSSYGSGFLLRDSMNTTLSGNTFFNNTVGQIEVVGVPGGFVVTDWVTKRTYPVDNSDFTLTGNSIQGGAGQQVFRDSSLSGSDWTRFVTTFTSRNNTWWNPTTESAFTVPTPTGGEDLDFGLWQTQSGQDNASTWQRPANDPTSKCTVTADQPDYWLVADNDVVTTDAAGNAVFNLTTLPLGGLTGSVNLAVDGISAIPGATVTLNPVNTTTSGGSVLTFNAGRNTRPGTYTFTVLANTQSVTRTITMSATVPVTSVRLSSDQLTFTDQPVGRTSAGQKITLTNTGSAALSIISIKPTTAYTEIDTCGTSLPAGKACTITVTFYPRQLITYTGRLSIVVSDPSSPEVVSLAGTTVGAPGITFSPKLLSFGAERFMQPTQPQTITATNNGTAILNITSVKITGDASGDFTQTNRCASVAPGATCPITVTFTPTATGSRSASVEVTDDVSGSPQQVSLSGTGQIALSISPQALGFGTIRIGITATQTATLTNASAARVNIASFSVIGPSAGDYSQTNNCGTHIAGNGTCTITIKYAPQRTGLRTATLQANDDDPKSPQTVSLSGTGGNGSGN